MSSMTLHMQKNLLHCTKFIDMLECQTKWTNNCDSRDDFLFLWQFFIDLVHVGPPKICEWQFSNYQQKYHDCTTAHRYRSASFMLAKVYSASSHCTSFSLCWTVYVKCDDNETNENVECAELTALNDLSSGEQQINFNTNGLIRRNNR